jgi:hypothetical protein
LSFLSSSKSLNLAHLAAILPRSFLRATIRAGRDDGSEAVSICSTGLGHMKPLTVSVKRGRELLDIGNTKIWEMINDGRLKTIKLDRKRLIVYSSLEKLIEAEAA